MCVLLAQALLCCIYSTSQVFCGLSSGSADAFTSYTWRKATHVVHGIPCAEAPAAATVAAGHKGTSSSGCRASTTAAVLVIASLVMPVLLEMPGSGPQQVKALSTHWQAGKLWMLALAGLIPAGSTQQKVCLETQLLHDINNMQWAQLGNVKGGTRVGGQGRGEGQQGFMCSMFNHLMETHQRSSSFS